MVCTVVIEVCMHLFFTHDFSAHGAGVSNLQGVLVTEVAGEVYVEAPG